MESLRDFPLDLLRNSNDAVESRGKGSPISIATLVFVAGLAEYTFEFSTP